MSKTLLSIYRSLPWFKGKLRLGKLLFRNKIESSEPLSFSAHHDIIYHVPNTMENLGIELLINGIYEQDVVRFLKRHIPDNAVYFDIGANIGSLGLPVVTEKKGVRYYGFEASPFVFPYLEKNFASNGVKNYQLVNSIVHKDDHQHLKFYQSNLYGKSSLAPTYSSDFINLPSVSIESFCASHKIEVIDWMKIDVQGFELYVFEGMKSLLLKKQVKNILFEFESWAEEAAGLKAGEAKQYLENVGYSLFDLDGRIWQQENSDDNTMIWAKPNSAQR